jgi:hypothetical protein
MILPDEGLIKPEEEKYFRDYEFFDEKGERYWEFDYGSIPLVSDIASSKVLREKAVKVFNSTGILEGYQTTEKF